MNDENNLLTPPPAWQLKSLEGQRLPLLIDIPPDGLGMGRDESNGLALSSEEFPHVSTHHARLHLVDGHLFIEDLGSKNGTIVNGKVVQGRVELKPGDAIQLGSLGPRLMAIHAGSGKDTLSMEIVQNPQDDSLTLSGTKIVRMKKALGIPEDADVSSVLRSRSRKQLIVVLFTVAIIGAAGTYGFLKLRQESSQLREDSERSVAELQQLSEFVQSGLSDKIRSAQERLDERTNVWTKQKLTLEESRDELKDRLEKLEDVERASSSEIGTLRTQLGETNKNLERLNPITLEDERLRNIRVARKAIVLIEMTLTFENEDSGELLSVFENEQTGELEPNFNGVGTPFTNEATGSGFCVSDEGWIITNAHVVAPENSREKWSPSPELTLVPKVDLKVVFSGDMVRHQAQAIKVVNDGDRDLALVKIEPFDEMPVLPNFAISEKTPEPLSEVFILGFPLGKSVIQEGNRVIASSFKGILSRVVHPYYQVDAGVHPGNSGGPLLDRTGNVIGVVTAVQGSPEGSIATIGYVIPISAAKDIWPPPTE